MVQVQISRWIDRLRRAGSTKGPAQSPIGEELYGSIQVDDMLQSPYKWLSRDFLVSWPFNVTGAAGQFPSFSLSYNPVPPGNYLLWIRKLIVSASVANSALVIAINPGGLGAQTGVNAFSRDLRALPLPAGPNTFLAGLVNGSTSSDVAVRAAVDIAARYSLLQDSKIIDVDWILPTANTWNIQGQSAASTIAGTVEAEVWQQQPSET